MSPEQVALRDAIVREVGDLVKVARHYPPKERAAMLESAARAYASMDGAGSPQPARLDVATLDEAITALRRLGDSPGVHALTALQARAR